MTGTSHSIQVLNIDIGHNIAVLDAVLKGARGNTSLKKLTIQLRSRYVQGRIEAAAVEL